MLGTVELATHEWPPTEGDADAPVAVLVHGVTGWWKTWWRVGPALARQGWRVVAVDQRGHGRSPRIGDRATVADLADDLGAAIRQIGAPIGALIGHSLGGAVSIELAHREPALVRRLVLEDPPAVSRAGDVEWLARLERELAAAREDPAGEVARELSENPVWLDEDARQDVEGRGLADAGGIVESFRRDIGARVLDLAPGLRVPALFVLASEGRSVFPPAPRRRLEATLPEGSRIRVFEAGHVIHRDRFDDYVRTVLAWITPGE